MVYTPQELADMLKIDLRTVYIKMRTGKIQAIKIGSNWRIKDTEVNRILSEGTEK